MLSSPRKLPFPSPRGRAPSPHRAAARALTWLRRRLGTERGEVTARQLERWRSAHAGERAFWLGCSEQDFLLHERGYRALAVQLQQHLSTFGIGPDYRGLQIGCAVQDVIFFMTGGERHAVDPLADFYKQHFARSRDPGVSYRQAMGEALPFADGYFDLVICQNVLDHVASCSAVLREVRRVLGPARLAYFGVDVYDESTARERTDTEARGEIADLEHPHTFTRESLERTLEEQRFAILGRWPPQPSGKGDSSWRHCLIARTDERAASRQSRASAAVVPRPTPGLGPDARLSDGPSASTPEGRHADASGTHLY